MNHYYTYHTIINSHDTDANGIVKPSAVLKYMQEAANLQLSVSKPSSDDLRADNRYFVASKISFTIYQTLYSWDEVDVSTWGCESKGAIFNRCSKIERNGELCAALSSSWALLDAENGAILRVSDVSFDFGTEPALQPELPLKVRIPKELPLHLVGERTVMYTDVDLNRHMNNTVYPDMLFGFVGDHADKQVRSVSINYLHEAPDGVTFKVYENSFADLSYFRTVLPDGSIGVEAEFRYTPLEQRD